MTAAAGDGRRRAARRCAATMLLLAAALVPAPAGGQEGDPIAPFVGTWHLSTWFTTPDGGRREGEAVLTVTRLESDQAPMLLFVESHRTARDGVRFTSRAPCAYHAETGTWRGVSVNSRANRRWREISFVNGELRIVEHGELFGGGTGFRRFVYSAVRDACFDGRMERSDDGTDWQDGGYGFHAERTRAD